LIGPLKKGETILAVWQPDFIWADPNYLANEIRERVGKSNFIDAHVSSLVVENNRAVGVKTEEGDYYSDSVVAATGYNWNWLSESLRPPIEPIQGEMIVVQSDSDWSEIPCLSTPGGSIVPMDKGRIWIGVSSRKGDVSREPRFEDVAKIAENANLWCPALADARVVSVAAGVRPGSADGLPFFGKTSLEGLLMVAGSGRAGIIQMPVAGEIISKSLLGVQDEHMLDLSPKRFTDIEY